MKDIVLLVTVLTNSSLISMTPEYIKLILSTALSVVVGLVLRLALEWSKGRESKRLDDRLTVGRAVTYAAFSTGVGYLSFFLFEGKRFMYIPAEFWIAILSFAAPYLIKALNGASKDRSRDLVDGFLDRVLGKKKEN